MAEKLSDIGIFCKQAAHKKMVINFKHKPVIMNFKNIRVSAAVVSIVYIAIQAFQAYVFSKFPNPASSVEELQLGNHTLHLIRSSLMLAAMFGLLFVRYVICWLAVASSRFWATLAFISYFTFFMLEILLRSIELFYIQLNLPGRVAGANTSDLQSIVDKFQTFQSIQSALYFPLILAGTISYAILLFLFSPVKLKINWLIKFVMGIDILRSLWRLCSDYFKVKWLQGNWYDQMYLPLVFITFGSISIWLLKVKDQPLIYEDKIGQVS